MSFTDPKELRRALVAALPPEPPTPEASDWIRTEYAIAAASSAIAQQPWGTTADGQEVAPMSETIITPQQAVDAGATVSEPAGDPTVPLPVAPDESCYDDKGDGVDERSPAADGVKPPTRRSRSAGQPDPKPAARTRRSRSIAAIRNEKPSPVAKPPAEQQAAPMRSAGAEAQREARAAKKRAKSVAELLAAGKIERNAITEAVAQHGSLQRAAKDAGVDVKRVEEYLRPGTRTTSSAKRPSMHEHAKLLAAYLQADGKPRERCEATGNAKTAWYVVWLAGLRSGQKRQPKPDVVQKLRTETVQVAGKPWAQLVKGAPDTSGKKAK